MAKTFNDMFPGGEGFVAKSGRKWKSVRTGNVYSETERTRVVEGEMRDIIREPTGEKTFQPYVRDLTLLEPIGREAIHAALDAYLEAAAAFKLAEEEYESAKRNEFEKSNAQIDASGKRLEA